MAKITVEQIDLDFRGLEIQQNEDEMRSWQCLSHETLSLILSNLVAREIVNFRAVCKWWERTPPPITGRILSPLVSSETPFLLFKTTKLFHQLFHPINIFSSHLKLYELPRINVRASGFGWLLVTLFGGRIFFINPFTKEKIELPKMENFNQMPQLTFSSPPTSPNCLVFGFTERCDEINIHTVKPGQLEWTCETFDINPGFKLLSCNPILFKGLYYCLGKFGSLLIYDLERNKSEWVVDGSKSRWPILRNLCLDSPCYMVESEGQMLLVFHNIETEGVNVFRLDRTSTGIWKKIDTLGDTMLFVSEAASFSVKSVTKGPGNKIFFPRLVGDKVVFFSLDTHRYHCFDEHRSWKNMNKAIFYPHSTWIMPCLSSD